MRRSRGQIFILSSLYWLVARGVVFFFIFSLLLFLLYLLGNFQEFLDSTQIFLIKLLKISLLAEVFLGILYILLVFILRRQRRYYLKLIFCSLSVVISYLLLLAFSFLSAWFQL
ncbi:MAG: hypothetical protein KAR73_00135 [Spirochaetales bacterium]|nr:hypothetical protein [Spirochaetales bacterium]